MSDFNYIDASTTTVTDEVNELLNSGVVGIAATVAGVEVDGTDYPAADIGEAVTATVLAYTPDDAGVWDGSPTTLTEAVDRLAAVVGVVVPIP